MGNRTRADIDYNLVAPHRITDPNDNMSEVLYDPLGITVVSTAQGRVLGPDDLPTLYGNDRLSAYTVQLDADFTSILAEPARFVQNASQFMYYELDTWETSRLPLRGISLMREAFVHDGRGGGTPSSLVQTTVTYTDGYGRTVQSKQRVEPGPAISRDDSGAIVLDGRGSPEEEHVTERWLVSGHIVYNNKQQPVRRYEPFYSSRVEFEPDAELQTFGVATHTRYDAVGQVIRVDLPNGALTRVEPTPWETRSFDPNDTVMESTYKILRDLLPGTDPEKQALARAEAHANTPSIIRLDPLGREIVRLETTNDADNRLTESHLDSQGNVISITDPRGLMAFTYQRDMLGRVLHEHSIDAGDTWTLADVLDRAIHRWDGRGVHQHFSSDVLDRPTSVFIDGALGHNQIVERMEYGDSPGFADASLKNARGRLVAHYDQAGLLSVRQYSSEGNPLHTQRQLLASYKAEPDWDDPATTLDPSPPFATETAYDALGRVTRQQLPDGTSRSIAYLQSGGVTQVTVTTADGVRRDEPFLQEANYNARGQRTHALFGNGVEVIYEYDEQTFRMRRLTTRDAVNGGRTYQDIAYTYDPVGNITRQLDHAQEPDGAREDVLQGLTVSSLGGLHLRCLLPAYAGDGARPSGAGAARLSVRPGLPQNQRNAPPKSQQRRSSGTLHSQL